MKNYSLYMSEQLYQKIKELAEKEHRKFNPYVIIILENFVKQKSNICVWDAIFYMKQLFPEKNLIDEQIEKYIKNICEIDSIPDDFELTNNQLEKLKHWLDIEKLDL